MAARLTAFRLSRHTALLGCAAVALLAGGASRADDASGDVQTVIVAASRARNEGAGVSQTGANDYAVTSQDIKSLPNGENTRLTDVLAQMPGVAIDQNQQIHIRNTEGPQFQYNINGILVPFDVNTNPPFVTMFNATFVEKMDLLTGVLPSRYSYATGGVVDIATKDGCSDPGGNVSFQAGQRGTLQPSVQYAGCADRLSYYASALYSQGQTAYSQATPGAAPIHDETHQGQGLTYLTYDLDNGMKLGALFSATASDNQLPNVPDLAPQFALAGNPGMNSSQINSYLDFRDYLGILSLKGEPSQDLSYQIAYAAHWIDQEFKPDNAGELIYQGVASRASHKDIDNTLQGDVTYRLGDHTIGSGFYLGAYHVMASDRSLVFPVDGDGNQLSTVPQTVTNGTAATNIVTGLYVDDLWQISDSLKMNIGLRWDDLTGFTSANQFDPSVNLIWAATDSTVIHAGYARYMQVPSFLGISPTAYQSFLGTTGATGSAGTPIPRVEDDSEFDMGFSQALVPHLTLTQDFYYEITHHYLDTGQFGVVPIFAPFNYGHGFIWGSETAITYRAADLSIYANATIGRNIQKGVVTGQFNYGPDELAYIGSHYKVLDHQPLYGAAMGASYDWEPVSLNLDVTYSSGLRAGFADTERLPTVVQVNAGAEYRITVPGIGKVSDRLTVLNLLDRTNLIRPANGVGIFQSAYGPRRTLLNTVSVPF